MALASDATVVGVVQAPAKGIITQTWAFVSGVADQVGNAIGAPMYPDKTIILNSTGFTASGTSSLTLEGSNSTSPSGIYFPLHAAAPSIGPLNQIQAVSSIGAGATVGPGIAIVLLDNPRWIRPRASTATHAFTVSIICNANLR
jgi:hypothetical protein